MGGKLNSKRHDVFVKSSASPCPNAFGPRKVRILVLCFVVEKLMKAIDLCRCNTCFYLVGLLLKRKKTDLLDEMSGVGNSVSGVARDNLPISWIFGWRLVDLGPGLVSRGSNQVMRSWSQKPNIRHCSDRYSQKSRPRQ